jgi:hypothetical protein
MSTFGYLLDRLDLELIGIPLAAHDTPFVASSLRLKGVY